LLCKKETKNPKFCSRICAAKFNTPGRKHKRETRVKISKSLGGSGVIKRKFLNCLSCGKQLSCKKKFCNLHCFNDYKYKVFIKQWFEGKITGTKKGGASSHIKRYFIETYGNKCMKCGWNKENPYYKTIPIELHHKDGIWKHNRPENLELVCPNCHSLTKNYRFKNSGNGRKFMRKYRYRYL